MVYNNSLYFTDNVGQFLSATDQRILRQNVSYIDTLTYRPMDPFASSGGVDSGTPGSYYRPGKPPTRLGRWWLRYRSSMTTLYIDGVSAKAGAEYIKVYINGTAQTPTITTNGTWSQSYTLSGLTDGQVIPIDVWVEGSSSIDISAASYVIREIRAGPAPKPADSWPGLPTFTTTLNAAHLNQLCAAIDWLYRRIQMVPITPGILQLYANGPASTRGIDGAGRPLGYYGIRRNYSQDVVKVRGQVDNPTTPQIDLQLVLNGSAVVATTSIGPGLGQAFSLSFDPGAYGIAVGQFGHMAVVAKTVVEPDRSLWQHGRWSFNTRMEPAAGSAYPYAALPAPPSDLQDLTGEQLRDYLISLASIVSAAKTRIDGAPHVWDRVRAARQWFNYTDKPEDVFPKRALLRFERNGSPTASLFVYGGGNVQMLYGARTVGNNDKGIAYDDYKYESEDSVLSGEQAGSTIVYLAGNQKLPPGTFYQLRGEKLWYAEEFL